MHALPRWTVRARIPRRLDSTHELLLLGGGVLSSCDLDRMGCDSLLNLWGRHLRDGHWLPLDGQHGLPRLHPQQLPYRGLWLVHVQRQLLRADPHRDDWDLHGLPHEQRAADNRLYGLRGERGQLLPVLHRND